MSWPHCAVACSQFAGTGYYTLLGAETAQGLPNAQLFYAFLRGAARQYGTLIWGDASVYNRFGFKTCALDAIKSNCACSAAGTSVSLFRRLMSQQALYGSRILSFEAGLSCAAATAGAPGILSPIGKAQQAVQNWTRSTGVGTLLTSTGVLLDFF